MIIRFLCLFIALSCAVPLTGHADNIQQIIEDLGIEIKRENNSLQKSKLHIYRARHYTRLGEWEKGLEDYTSALELNHQAWIHLERSRFLMATGNYRLAYEDAVAAKNELKTLAPEANEIIRQAVDKIDDQNTLDNPPTIIMDSRANPNRKSRFDLMEAAGIFDAKEKKLRQSRQKRMASRPQQAPSAAPVKSQPKRRG